eukprot:8503719-Karenia_brevis.AAC.1
MVSLKRVLERAAAEVDLERAMPQLYRLEPDGKVVEAILDVVAILPGSFVTMPFDVTIRCPHNQDFASHRPSVAAKDGEVDKSS